MIYEKLWALFRQQNFAIIATNAPSVGIFRNQAGGRGIICALVDNTGQHLWTASLLQSLHLRLASLSIPGISSDPLSASATHDVLFIVITADTERDKHLARPGINVWLVDSREGSLLIYEDQPDDFYGLRSEIEAAIQEDSDDPAMRYADLHFSPSASASATGSTVRARKKISYFPTVTVILIALNVLCYAVLALIGNVRNISFMAAAGANYGPYIFENFQLWRLLTSMFMHFGLPHLLGNMVYLGLSGYNLERAIGHGRFLLIYMLAGIGGNVVSAAYYYVTNTNTISVGASGAIYGLVGAICYLTFLSYRRMQPAYVFLRIGMVLIFVFYSSFISPGVDGAAHIGGFIFGVLLAILFIRRRKNEKR
ncbi:MAG: rhomboid family intramembrane serine protease [Lachnospiraceae bacterium]|jgi:rhomboid protease GluP